MGHEVFVNDRDDRQGLHRIDSAFLHAGKELLQQRRVRPKVHAVKFGIEHCNRNACLHRLVLQHCNLRVNGEPWFRSGRSVAVNEITSDTLSGDVTQQIASASIVKATGDLVELAQGKQTVGGTASTDRTHGNGFGHVDGLDHFDRHTALSTAGNELSNEGVTANVVDHTANDLTQQTTPACVEQVDRGASQAAAHGKVVFGLQVVPVRGTLIAVGADQIHVHCKLRLHVVEGRLHRVRQIRAGLFDDTHVGR